MLVLSPIRRLGWVGRRCWLTLLCLVWLMSLLTVLRETVPATRSLAILAGCGAGLTLLWLLTWQRGQRWPLAAAVLLIGGITAVAADLDRLKRLPFVGRLPWSVWLGNTALRAAPHDIDSHQRFLARTAAGPIDRLFLGDSHTSRWLREGRAAWEAYLAGPSVANFGIGEDRIEHLLWRIRHGELDGYQARQIVLMIGTNNLQRNTANEIREAVAVILEEIHRRQPAAEVILMAIPPYGARPDDPMRLKVDAVNGRLAELASERVTFLDLTMSWLEPDGTFSPRLTTDGIHLTAAGYAIWAEALHRERLGPR